MQDFEVSISDASLFEAVMSLHVAGKFFPNIDKPGTSKRLSQCLLYPATLHENAQQCIGLALLKRLSKFQPPIMRSEVRVPQTGFDLIVWLAGFLGLVILNSIIDVT